MPLEKKMTVNTSEVLFYFLSKFSLSDSFGIALNCFLYLVVILPTLFFLV